jgi:hypothetical protein
MGTITPWNLHLFRCHIFYGKEEQNNEDDLSTSEGPPAVCDSWPGEQAALCRSRMVVGDAEGNAFAGLAKNRRPTQKRLSRAPSHWRQWYGDESKRGRGCRSQAETGRRGDQQTKGISHGLKMIDPDEDGIIFSRLTSAKNIAPQNCLGLGGGAS